MPEPGTWVSSSFETGFSLLELIFVLVLLAIMSAFAIPSWSKLLPSYHLSSSARQLQSELQSIKMRAAAENTSFQLVYRQNSSGYTIQKDRQPTASKMLPEGVVIANDGTISFSPRGTAAGNTIRLRASDGRCKQVVTSPTGRVRVCTPSSCLGEC